MDELLKPVKTKLTVVKQERRALDESPQLPDDIETPEDALRVLRESPSLGQVQKALSYLYAPKNEDFNIKQPGALAAQLIQALVTLTLPDFWTELRHAKELSRAKFLFLNALLSVSGLGALLSQIKVLTTACRSTPRPGKSVISPLQLKAVLQVTGELLGPETVFESIWTSCILLNQGTVRRAILWKEFIFLVASGRLMSTFAEAEDVLKKFSEKHTSQWVSKGSDYTRWIAQNIAHMIEASKGDDIEKLTAVQGIWGKTLTLGYSDVFVDELLYQLVVESKIHMPSMKAMVQSLHAYEQRSFLKSTLRSISKMFSPSLSQDWILPTLDRTFSDIAGATALLHDFLTGNEILQESLVDLFIKLESSPLVGSDSLQRVALSSISSDEDRIASIMEKSMERFGDQLFVKHAPMVQQEATARILLMSSGYVHRKHPMLLFTLAKSSTQMHAVSNRLNATSPRARWLGMLVSMTMSELTDKVGSRLVFTDETLETPEAKWYRNLVHIEDKIGRIDDIRSRVKALHNRSEIRPMKNSLPILRNKYKSKHGMKQTFSKPTVSGPRIIDLDDNEDDEDLVPYAKPDSDPEDEDDDPTLVQRNKPKPPVYIRDLIAGLRDSENYDRHRLALTTASNLIRRKANFGKEVNDHAEELASILAGLQDHFEMDDFLVLRQDALIAILIAQPTRIAQYLARSCFEGDYSLQQRTAMFTALGLGARELAGFKNEAIPDLPPFPTKQLPEHLHRIYNARQVPSVVKISEEIEHSMVQPMTLQAADQLSGPDAIKVRTFSSRMAVEKARKKAIPNELAKIVAQNFFFPLTGRWWTQVQSCGNQSLAFSTHLLPIYLRTLAILLHASGPSTLSLPQMTSELWDMLLSLRNSALNDNDVGVLESLLFVFLTLLEVNEDKQRLATEHAKELVETQEWARLVLEKRETGMSKGDEEGQKVRMLAAAVVVRCHEVVERWQRLMLGDMVDL